MIEKQPPDLERCFVLYMVQNLPVKQVSEILGLSPTRVSILSHRFQERNPERAHELLTAARTGATVHDGNKSEFLERVRREAEATRTPAAEDLHIAGFDDADEPNEAEAPAEVVDPNEDAITYTRRLLRSAQERGRKAELRKDHVTAQRCGRDAADLVVVLARLEKVAQADENVLRISLAEIEKAKADVMQKAIVVCSRPLTCSECGKRLRIKAATSIDDDDPEDK